MKKKLMYLLCSLPFAVVIFVVPILMRNIIEVEWWKISLTLVGVVLFSLVIVFKLEEDCEESEINKER